MYLLSLIPENLKLIHVLLAYAGMFLHLLFKIQKAMNYPGYVPGSFIKKPSNIISIIISIISIPVLLIMATDPIVANTLPINNVTSVFAGWQTNSMFRNLMSMYSKKPKQTNPDNES